MTQAAPTSPNEGVLQLQALSEQQQRARACGAAERGLVRSEKQLGALCVLRVSLRAPPDEHSGRTYIRMRESCSLGHPLAAVLVLDSSLKQDVAFSSQK